MRNMDIVLSDYKKPWNLDCKGGKIDWIDGKWGKFH